jgi:uncharacterized RDD family membrane protein YckC
MADERCANCGNQVPEGADYCPACGTQVSAPPGPPTGDGQEQGQDAGQQPREQSGQQQGWTYAPGPQGGQQGWQQQPGYTPPPGYGQQPPYGQPPYGQPPYGQPPYGQQPGYGYSAYSRYAGFWRRFVAIIIDGIIVGIIGSIFRFLLLGAVLDSPGRAAAASALYALFSLVIQWLYYTLMEASSNQATLGKMALGIVVTDLEGRRISWGRANARYWSKIISAVIFMIGFIMAGFTEKKQALHDMIAGTLVVVKDSYR